MNLLVTAPKFFGYEKLICKEFESKGFNVTYIDDKLKLNFILKAFLRLNIFTPLIFLLVKKSFKSELNENNFDNWLCINPEGINKEIVEIISKKVINKKIIYVWDSLNNKPNILKIINLFDKKYSFDNKDCVNHNLIHLPLYYTYHYKNNHNKNKLNRIVTIGSVHSDRIKIIDLLLSKGININYFLFVKNKILTLYFIIKGVLPIKYYKNVSSKSFSHSEIHDLYDKYKYVLDITHPSQNGLTNRTFEVLASGCFLITTNANIKNYEFYSNKNIFILNRDFSNIASLRTWINNNKRNYCNYNMSSYSLKSWINQII
jgi:hypothetical protein